MPETFRIIRAAVDYSLIIVVQPADATPETQDAKYYRCASWQIAAGGGVLGSLTEPTFEAPDVMHEITRGAAMTYFSGIADGLGFGTKPEETFDSLDAVLTYRAQQREERSILPEFFHLLGEAQEAAKAVDDFDLHSENPESMVLFGELQASQTTAAIELIHYIQKHGAQVIARLERSQS